MTTSLPVALPDVHTAAAASPTNATPESSVGETLPELDGPPPEDELVAVPDEEPELAPPELLAEAEPGPPAGPSFPPVDPPHATTRTVTNPTPTVLR